MPESRGRRRKGARRKEGKERGKKGGKGVRRKEERAQKIIFCRAVKTN